MLGCASYTHKQAWYIKAMSFWPGCHDKLVTCGVEHIKQWECVSGQLVYSNVYQNDPNRVTTVMSFLQGTLVTGNDEGEIVLWHSEPQTHREHQLMVNSLATATDWMVSGSLSTENEAQVVIWRYGEGQLSPLHRVALESTITFPPLMTSKPIVNKPDLPLEVQSLAIDEENPAVLIGTSRGDIFHYDCQWMTDSNIQSIKELSSLNHLLPLLAN